MDCVHRDQSNYHEGSAIAVVRPDGTGLRFLTRAHEGPDQRSAGFVSWLNATRLVFVSDERRQGRRKVAGIHSIGLDGRNERRVTYHCHLGTPANDILRGSILGDTLRSLAGADEVVPGPGKDDVDSGAGADLIRARTANAMSCAAAPAGICSLRIAVITPRATASGWCGSESAHPLARRRCAPAWRLLRGGRCGAVACDLRDRLGRLVAPPRRRRGRARVCALQRRLEARVLPRLRRGRERLGRQPQRDRRAPDRRRRGADRILADFPLVWSPAGDAVAYTTLETGSCRPGTCSDTRVVIADVRDGRPERASQARGCTGTRKDGGWCGSATASPIRTASASRSASRVPAAGLFSRSRSGLSTAWRRHPTA